MEIHGSAEGFLGPPDARDMIHMRVREEDVFHRELLRLDNVEEGLHLVARIDQDGLARRLAANNETVLVEGRDLANFEQHDDLYFCCQSHAAIAARSNSTPIVTIMPVRRCRRRLRGGSNAASAAVARTSRMAAMLR